MAALDDLTFTHSPTRTWTAAANKTGSTYQQIKNAGSHTDPTFSIKKSTPNASVGGGDMMHSSIYSIAGAGNTTIDLTSLVDVLERSGGSFARVKYVEFILLGTADDTQGTAASSVTIGNAASNPFVGPLGGTTPTVTLLNGESATFTTRTASGWAVSGSAKNIKILNNDATVTAKVRVTIVGGTT